MDIFEQVERVLKDLDRKEKATWKERRLAEGLVLTELISRYNRYVAVRQWDSAHECLRNISRIASDMLAD
jgi:hypothetical protein